MFLARTLSGRLLLLTVVIVMVAEVLVFLPSVARFREDYLVERLQMAQIASLALLAAEDAMVEEALEAELLENAEVSSIVLRRDFARQLVLAAPEGAHVDETFDLRRSTIFDLTFEALTALTRSEPRVIRVIGEPMKDGGLVIEITMAEMPLCAAMLAFGLRVLWLSLFISGITGILVFLICRRLIVRPMETVVDNMVAFQKDPERGPLAGQGGSGLVEIQRAETALSEMEREIRAALLQKSRLADLGAAVAKISHDLRNMLASAQLMADRLDGSSDPVVNRVGPKLIRSLDRAASLCVSTLKHGKAEEAPPELRRVRLHALIEDVRDAVFADGGPVSLRNDLPRDLEATVDPDHLFRVFANLMRNAREAILAASGRGEVVVEAAALSSAAFADKGVRLTVRDDGPGMPAKALENLFQPFRGGARRGGTGLGLAIAAELAAANGGGLALVETSPSGTVFAIDLPG